MAKASTKTATKTAKKPAAKKTTKATTKKSVKSTATTAAKKAAKVPAKSKAASKKKSAVTKTPAKSVKLPAGYTPTAKEEYMNDKQLEYFRLKLMGWRTELLAESKETMDNLKEENWHEADIADRASLETEAGVELRTRNRYLKLVGKIDAALRRIAEGEYGFCEETGDPIGLKRLEARPIATLSIEAQERHERMEKQYSDDD